MKLRRFRVRFKLQEKFGVFSHEEGESSSFGFEAQVVGLWFINRMRYICIESFEW
jgi:hypothetical protein